MRFIADFHIHSKYSRATSRNMILPEIDRVAHNKGILVMGTGDFTHPAWFEEIKEKLEPVEPGLFKLKKEFKLPTIRGNLSDTRFILTVEISGIYSKNGRTYRIHNIIFAPDLGTASKINARLGLIGNLNSDGRPILGLDSRELAKIVFNINPKAVIIPAHAWTPWFSLFGSMSGFDSIDDCFGEYSKHIFAIETGLSSDPKMNWRLSQLDKVSLISNSDSHSLERIGREANIFDTELSYDGIVTAIKSRDPEKFIATIEFFPEEGKYHLDGHRACSVVLEPEETEKLGGICPQCNRRLTIGVLNRVAKLADRPIIKTGFKNNKHYYENRVPFYYSVPLDEIIAKSFYVGTASRKVKNEYENLIKKFSGEFNIIMETSSEELAKENIDPKIIAGIVTVREGRVKFDPPGYDGEYGKMVFTDSADAKIQELAAQKSLF
jgi:uncharacterized protein (TIGR00375 family)